MKPGERIPLKGAHVHCVSSNGEVLAKAMNGGKGERHLKDAQQKEPDLTGKRTLPGIFPFVREVQVSGSGATLTWDQEMKLACPINKVGQVTMFEATMHGFFNDRSGPPALVWAMRPQVVVVNNGARKGLLPPAYERIAKSPGLEDIWQGHLALANDAEHNTAQDRIANLDPSAECKGNWLKVSVEPNGSYTVTNGRNSFSKTYSAR